MRFSLSSKFIAPLVFCLGALLLFDFAAIAAPENNELPESFSRAPELLWEWSSGNETPLHAEPDAEGGQVLYVAMRRAGVQLLSTAGGAQPRPLSRVPYFALGGMEATSLAQRGHMLYVALGNIFSALPGRCGLAAIDVSDKRRPRVLSLWRSSEPTHGASSLLIDGDALYLGAMRNGLLTFDISNPEKPVMIGKFRPDINYPRPNPGKVAHPNVRGMALRDNLLYVCYDAGGLRILDVSDKRNPKEIGRYINPRMKMQQAYNGVAIDYPYAYFAVDYAGVEVVDVSDPQNPKQVSWWDPWNVESGRNRWFNSGGHTNQIVLDRQKKLLFLSCGDSELIILDVSEPFEPRLASRYGGIKDRLGAWGVSRDGDTLYLTYIKAFIPFSGRWNGIKALRWSAR